MNRYKTILALAAALMLLLSMTAVASAEATISASTDTPIVGEEITFTVGTTMEGMEATITTTGLSYVSNTGLGNQTHAITVPGVGSAYTYRVTANEGETVSFVLSDVQEADDQGNEVSGQRVTWMAAAERAAEPSNEPSQEPTDEPTQEPSDEPSQEPTQTPSPGDQGSEQPTQTETPAPSGNPSPTVNPSQEIPSTTDGNITGGTTGGGTTSGGGTSTGGNSSGGTSSNPPKTGDISHFWIWVGIGALLTVVVVAAGKRVFAD